MTATAGRQALRADRHIRVLDISAFLAGSAASSLLAEFGAEVIKVEQPGGGDPLRHLGREYEGVPLWWALEQRNKKGITLNLQHEEGQDLFRRLVSRSDVVIENFRPGTLDGWGLSFPSLQEVQPALIMLSVSGFGQTGPYSCRPALGRSGEGIGGMSYLTGDPEGPPGRAGVAISDYMTGLFGALGVLLALYYRDAQGTGLGQWIDATLYESMFRFLEDTVPTYDKLGVVRQRVGLSVGAGAAPADAYRAGDGKWLTLAVPHDGHFRRLTHAMGMEELNDDPRFGTNADRIANRGALDSILQPWLDGLDRDAAVKRLEAEGVVVSAIYSIADIFGDPHYAAREAIARVTDARLGDIAMPAVTPRLSLTPGRVDRSGPALGEHNEEVYSGLLGLPRSEIDALRDRSVI